MTDRIDLDDLNEPTEDDPDRPNPGDWFWRGEGDPAAEPDSPNAAESDVPPHADEPADRPTEPPADSLPGVPRPTRGKPVGVPVESGGAGGGPSTTDRRAGTNTEPAATDSAPETTGPHGGGVDEMTMALTYRAATRLANPAAAFGDASQWTDWLGIVGDVDAHVINKFQRDHGVDADFFNGTGTAPAERLADIDGHSMFFAERMVVVGLDDERGLADRVGWEFVPLSEAAAKADWELAE